MDTVYREPWDIGLLLRVPDEGMACLGSPRSSGQELLADVVPTEASRLHIATT